MVSAAGFRGPWTLYSARMAVARHILNFTVAAIVAIAAILAAWAGWSTRGSLVLMAGLVVAFVIYLVEAPLLKRYALTLAAGASIVVALVAHEDFRPGQWEWWDLATRIDVLFLVFLLECRRWLFLVPKVGVALKWPPVRALAWGIYAFLWATSAISEFYADERDLTVHGCVLAMLLAAPGLAATARAVRSRVLSRRLRLVVAAASALVPAATVAAVTANLQEPEKPLPTHLAQAHRLRERLRVSYPHWEERGYDLDALWEQHREQLIEGAESCAPDDEFCRPAFHVLRDLFAMLDNAHTEIVIRDEIGVPPVHTRRTAEGAAISWVDPDIPHRGLCKPMVGDVIVAVQAEPVDVAIATLPRYLISGRGARAREISAYAHLLWGEPGTDVDVRIQRTPRIACNVRLRRESAALWSASEEEPSKLVESTVSRDGIGYLNVEGFAGGPGYIEAVDRALARVIDKRGLVVDLRGNGGGKVSASEHLASRFLEAPAQVGEVCRLGCFFGACFDLCDDVELEPARPSYSGRIAVLVDEEVASAAEYVAYVLCRHRGARCFGTTTAGSVDRVTFQEIGPAHVSISTARFHPATGPEIEGQGLEPDEPIELRAQDLRGRTDRVRAAAEAWLRHGDEAGFARARAD